MMGPAMPPRRSSESMQMPTPGFPSLAVKTRDSRAIQTGDLQQVRVTSFASLTRMPNLPRERFLLLLRHSRLFRNTAYACIPCNPSTPRAETLIHHFLDL